MNLSDDKIIRAAERMLKRTEVYRERVELGENDNFEVVLIVRKANSANPADIIAFAADSWAYISFYPFRTAPYQDRWDFSFDGILFDYLQTGYVPVLITKDCHYAIWDEIEAYHNGDIENIQGMHKYLGYCKRNGITQEKLDYPGTDVMKLYDPSQDRLKKRTDIER